MAPFPQGSHANSLEATESPLPALRGCCVADRAVEHGLTCLPAYASCLLWRAPGCHTPGNATKRFLPRLRFAACNLHCMRAALFAPLPLSKVLGPHQAGSFCCWSEIYSPSKCSLLLHSMLHVGLLHRHFTPVLCFSGNKVGRTRVVYLCLPGEKLCKS